MILSALVSMLIFTFSIITLLFIVERSFWLRNNNVNMQQIRFNYSLKNIGLPTHDDYRRNIIDKTENVIHRMRWRALFFLHSSNDDGARRKPTFGLKSKQTPPPILEMKSFEDDVIEMIENISFRNGSNEFIQTLENDKKKIKTSPNVFISADKTTNIYEMDATTYNKLLTENITKTYKLAQDGIVNDINAELKDIAHDLDIANRTEPMAQKQAFISLKDHKEDFENHPKCRLINPAKSNLGKVSKFILDKINSEIREQTCANQWRNSDDTISWFQSINNKDRHTFISFDIVDFYPSISETLLDEAIAWGKQFTTISDHDIKVIKHARKSVLFNNGQTWTKRNSGSTFDVTMGSFDGAEICELVGLLALHSLEARFGKNVGLYRDDGLIAINTASGRLADKARKDLVRLFDNLGLKITAQTNLKRANFLDITFDLTNDTYSPYRKPNDEPLYINRMSNHPPSILRQLPSSINKRINNLSCNKETFDRATPLYNDALKRSNFDSNLTYEPNTDDEQTTNSRNSNNETQKRNRRRNTIWYNPPYSKNVKTNIGQNFLRLIDKHFPPSNKLNKIFNRHTIRISYSCSDNMVNFINKHNKTILKRHYNQSNVTTNSTRTCNCRRTEECPAKGECLTESVIYQAECIASDRPEKKIYIGLTSNQFKTRYRNHMKSFNNQKYENDTELSKYVWKLKSAKRPFSIIWSFLKKVPAYKPGSRRCSLCLEEKLLIMKGRHKNLLNRRTEFFTKCRHVTKHQLC